jgi:D-beta-D-heptose 7-phosphate kinase/D-beta-D-heptose 1-phosphate adenosyltransferase
MIVGINSDASVSKLKGINRPLQKENDRALILANFSFIDAVVVFDEPTPLKLITTYQPNIITKGGDYDVEGVVGGKETMNLGGSVVLLPFIPGHSTSAIEQKILNR